MVDSSFFINDEPCWEAYCRNDTDTAQPLVLRILVVPVPIRVSVQGDEFETAFACRGTGGFKHA